MFVGPIFESKEQVKRSSTVNDSECSTLPCITISCISYLIFSNLDINLHKALRFVMFVGQSSESKEPTGLSSLAENSECSIYNNNCSCIINDLFSFRCALV